MSRLSVDVILISGHGQNIMNTIQIDFELSYVATHLIIKHDRVINFVS